MHHTPAGISRTWHSLWDEMFSAFTVFDPRTVFDPSPGNETFGADCQATARECIELQVLRLETGCAHNDNGRCAPHPRR